MRITLTSVPVKDQEHALNFYVEKLGFIKKQDIPMGEHRWLTLVSPEGPSEVELLLEPLGFEPAKAYYKSLYEAGIPVAQFEVDNLDHEMMTLKEKGVVFRGEAQEMGGVKFVMIEDSCDNLLCIAEKSSGN